MSSEADQSLLQIHDEQGEQHHGMQHLKLKYLNYFQILKYALKIITSNTKFTLLMIFSLLPFYIFMVFYEIKIPKINYEISKFIIPPSYSHTYDYNHGDEFINDLNDSNRNFLITLLNLFPFYFIFIPLLEIFSFIIIINIAQKIYTSNSESIIVNKETIFQLFNNKNTLKAPIISTLLVQFLSICTLSGLFWIVMIQYFINALLDYNLMMIGFLPNFILIMFNSLIIVAILYKYLKWSAFWNMDIVISVLQREIGVNALEDMSSVYGKNCKSTCFQLMVSFFVYSLVLRLPCLFTRMYDFVGVEVIIGINVIVPFLVCLGSLVKWVIFVVYYNDCKKEMLSKSVDEEVGKGVKDDDLVSSQSLYEFESSL